MSGEKSPIKALTVGISARLNCRREHSVEQETNEALVSAFVAKAYKDIRESGFTIQRAQDSGNEYTSEITNNSVIYTNGDNTYNIDLSAVKNKSGNPLMISSILLNLLIRDSIDLAELPSGEKRTGSIHKEVCFHTSDPEDMTPPGYREESGSVYFFKTIKHDVSRQEGNYRLAASGPDLSSDETNAFLRELLSCEVDTIATQAAFDKASASLPEDTVSIYWQRDNPDNMFSVFSE